jgi:uncharacterized protein YkwD
VPPACLAGDPAAAPQLFDELNRRRAAHGARPLDFSAPLCAAALRQVRELVERDDLISRMGDLDRLQRHLAALGYQPYRLLTASLQLRAGAAATWNALAAEHPAIAEEAESGDLFDIGVGVADDGGASIATILLALPRAEKVARQLAPFADRDRLRREVLDATNRAREAKGLPALEIDPALEAAAQAHADAMLARRFYGHIDPDLGDLRERMNRFGYRASALGENLARGIFATDEVVDRWLASPGHRRNLLQPLYRSIGIGISYDPKGDDQSVHWVQLFSSN